ncbi:MAG: hypothetical protein CL503_05635 [Actinobacteria bacterium]|nr:hypothetical protein [Actinomycetota bacterium]|tara:strand:- start:2660 stop:3820 length:1161 start_codon:yes stop_codon:yes gene_type:complete
MKTIVCLSSQGWNSDLWTNKQHIMSRFAKKGYRILYVNKEIRSFFECCYYSMFKKSKEFPYFGVYDLTEGVSFANSYSLLFKKKPDKQRFNAYGFKLKLIQPFFDKCDDDTIVWIYHPGYGDYLDMIPEKCRVVYDCVDDYKTFPEFSSDSKQQWIQQSEAAILKRADVVFATSKPLYNRLTSVHDNTHYVHNVGDYDHFNQVSTKSYPKPKSLQVLTGPMIGFFGALSDFKVDFNLLIKMAHTFPDYQWILMGPFDQSALEKRYLELFQLSNIHFLGKIAYSELPFYLYHMNALMIPYCLNEHTTHVFPIKFFEALATGKRLFITNLPALKDYYDVVDLFDEDTIKSVFSNLTHEDDTRLQNQLQLAKKFSWEYRVEHLLGAVFS